MKTRELLIICALLAAVTGAFFYPFFLQGKIPFPGDLLIAEYKPWRTESFLGYNPGSYPQKAQYFDTIRQLYPWKTAGLAQIRNLSIPLWNPYNFSGSPLLANNQSSLFYPLNIFYLLFSQPVAWAILVALQPFLAGLGTYLFSRKIGMNVRGAFLSAVAYGFCLFMSVFLEYNTMGHVMSWLPFTLLAIELLIREIRPAGMLLFTGSITASAFAGHLQLFIYVLMFGGAYFIFRTRMLRAKIRATYAVLLVLALGITAIQLMPTFELIGLAARAPQEHQFLIEKLLIQPYQLIVMIAPDIFGNPATYNYLLSDSYPGNALYIGLVPLMFALLSLAEWKKNGFIRLFSISALTLLLLIVRTPLTEFLYRLPVPLLSTSSPTNSIFLLSFTLAILSGFGFEIWEKGKKSFPLLLLAVPAALGIAWVTKMLMPDSVNTKNLLYSTLLFTLTAGIFVVPRVKYRWQWACVAGIFILAIADSFYFFKKFNPFVPPALVFPATSVTGWLKQHTSYDRFWGLGTARIEANFASQYHIYSPEGYDPLYPKWYGEFIWSSDGGKLLRDFTNRTRSDAAVSDGAAAPDTLKQGSPRKRTVDALSVKYILDRSENASDERTFPPDQFRLLYEENGWKIFENLTSVPRVFMTENYAVYATAAEFESQFFDRRFDPRKTVLLNHRPPFSSGDSTQGSARILSYNPNSVTVETSANSDQILVLTDAYYPGWVAVIDGQVAEILKANWTLRAVPVPKGDHTVKFLYKPESFSMGAKTTIISLIGFLVLCAWVAKNRRYAK